MRTMTHSFTCLVVVCLVSGLFVLSVLDLPQLWGQATEGAILGTVKDPQLAVLPAVSVSVTSASTGISRSVVTDANGNYEVTHLPIGVYNVSAERNGFKKTVVNGVQLTIKERPRVDIVLSLGELTESVAVNASYPLLKTDTSELGYSVSDRQLTELPLLNRQYLKLAQLVPGAVPARSGDYRTILDGISINISGARSESNNFILDGISNNNEYQLNAVVQPSVDAVQEFKVQAAQFAAEFGRASGGVINMAIKSGTNDVHGTLYEFHQNDNLNARSFFDTTKPPFIKNQFGFSLGGPVIKNKTFAFGAYEGNRSTLERTRRNIVPDPTWVKGNFSNAPFTVYDPATARPDPQDPNRILRDPFPNNIIPAGRIDPVGQVIADAYPAPNTFVAGDPINFVGLVPERRVQDQYIARLDHQFSSHDSIFGRVIVDDSDLGLAGAFVGLGATVLKKGINMVLSEMHSFSPRLINEVRLGYNYVNFPVTPDVAEDVVSEAGGIPGRAPAPGIPRGGPRNFTATNTAGLPGYSPPAYIRTHVYQALDNVTYSRGSHTLKAGFDIQRHQNFRWNNQTGGAGLSFDGRYTSGPSVPSGTPTFAANGLADMLLGLPNSASYRIPADYIRIFRTFYQFFLQDDWKISPRLTLNYGVRYDIFTSPSELRGRLVNVDYTTGRVLFSEESKPSMLDLGLRPEDIPFPNQFVPQSELRYKTDRNNWSPRLGFAYDRPFGLDKTVLRGGFGLFFTPPPQQMLSDTGFAAPFLVNIRQANDPAIPAFSLRTGVPVDYVGLMSLPGQYNYFDRSFRDAYSQKWSLGLQHEIGTNLGVEASYVGSSEHKLGCAGFRNLAPAGPGPVQGRRPLPYLAETYNWEAKCNGSYQGLQASAQLRPWHGLALWGSYTLSKSIGQKSAFILGSNGTEDEFLLDADNPGRDKGLSAFDVRNRMTLSMVYELPQLREKGRAVSLPFGSWQFSGILSLQNGQPFTINLGVDNLNNGLGVNRPDRIRNGNLPNSERTLARYFDLDAFAIPAQFQFGNAGQNILTGPGFKTAELALMKNFQVMERLKLQFRTEFSNAFNWVNFNPPTAPFPSPNYGRITSADTGRAIQFALKLIW